MTINRKIYLTLFVLLISSSHGAASLKKREFIKSLIHSKHKTVSRQAHCEGSTSFDDCGGGKCCQSPLKCCSVSGQEGCCKVNSSSGGTCFPSHATVELRDGSKIRMSEVKLGDYVLVAPGTYSKVFMFTHQDSRYAGNSYVKLQTTSGLSLTATKGHFIYACSPDDQGNCDVEAKDIEKVNVGDRISFVNKHGVSKLVPISERTILRSSGLYNPQTLHGDIIVDNVRCTTYTKTIHRNTAHALLMPLRAFYTVYSTITSSLS